MRAGVLLNSDSIAYFDAARVLRSAPQDYLQAADSSAALPGRFPPLYPTLLALISLAVPVMEAARWINVALIGTTLAIVATVIRRHSSVVAALVATIVLLCTRGFVIAIHGFMMSDALYLAVVMATISMTDQTLNGEYGATRHRLLMAGAIAGGALAFSTRLIGLTAIAAVALSLLLLRPAGQRLRPTILAITAGSVPVVAWIAVSSSAGHIGERPLGWFPPGFSTWSDLPDAVAHYFLPGIALSSVTRWPVLVATTVGLFAAALKSVAIFESGRRPLATSADRACAIAVVFAWTNLVGLTGSMLFVDPLVAYDLRHLMPIWGAVVIVLGIRLGEWSRSTHLPSRYRPRVIRIAVVAIALSMATITVHSIKDPSRSWFNMAVEASESPLVAELRQIPPGAVVYSNRPDLVVFFTTHDTVLPIPMAAEPATGIENDGYAGQIEAMNYATHTSSALVAVFTADPLWSPDLSVLKADGDLRVLKSSLDGVLLKAR